MMLQRVSSRTLCNSTHRISARGFSSTRSLRDSLVIAEHDGKSLLPATLNAITAATQFGKPVDVLVVGDSCGDAASAAASVSGVRRSLLVESASLAKPLAERVAEVILGIQKTNNYTHILAAATSQGKNILPRVGALLDVQPISDVQKIKSEDTFVRPIYAGNALQTVQSQDKVKVFTVRGTAYPKASPTGGSGKVEKVAVSPSNTASQFVSQDLSVSERPELTAADRVVSGGRAVKSAEGFKIVYTLADAINAAVGASRAAVDAGYAPNDLQVGQTGKVVAPTLYIAAGISGAIQHLAGMKDSKVIVAINTDPEAPIFQVANYGLVADLFTAIPELVAEIKKTKGK
jgi:electron transfer flavoprotein alpha subunit